MSEKNHIYFDCRTGVSGDMILGSLIDLGVDMEILKQELTKLNLGEFVIDVSEEEKYGVRGVNVYILQKYGHTQNQPRLHGNHEATHSHRSFREIEKIINDGNFSSGIKNRALSIYRLIAEAEANVHETDIDHVHFHEVGRNTAIMNIVGAAICLDLLEVEKVTCSALHDGTGFVECSHGLIPVPVPAVQELLKGAGLKFVQEEVNAELVTPSGLGILKGIQARYMEELPDSYAKIGFGFGKKDIGKLTGVKAYLLDKSRKSYKIF